MVDLGPITEDVDFAWDAASRLKHEFERAAGELDGQIGARRSAGDHAKHDWHGRYASVFEHSHMSCTIEDARAIVHELRICARMLEQLANLARQEEQRRRVARAWKVDHDKWARDQQHRGIVGSVTDTLFGDHEPKPPTVPEFRPQPFVATAPPTRERG